MAIFFLIVAVILAAIFSKQLIRLGALVMMLVIWYIFAH